MFACVLACAVVVAGGAGFAVDDRFDTDDATIERFLDQCQRSRSQTIFAAQKTFDEAKRNPNVDRRDLRKMRLELDKLKRDRSLVVPQIHAGEIDEGVIGQFAIVPTAIPKKILDGRRALCELRYTAHVIKAGTGTSRFLTRAPTEPEERRMQIVLEGFPTEGMQVDVPFEIAEAVEIGPWESIDGKRARVVRWFNLAKARERWDERQKTGAAQKR